MILHFVKDESDKNDTALPKIGTGPGDSKVDLRYRPEPAGGIYHAVMQESYKRLGLCNSYMILQFEKNASHQNATARSAENWDRTWGLKVDLRKRT